MSITTNVGAVADHLARQRLKPQYLTFKRYYRRVMNSGEIGRKVYRFTHKVKQALKQSLLPCSMFENMGFNYVGPVNGHDLTGLTRALRYARELNEPVLLHVKTVKGKGYAPAEENPGRLSRRVPLRPGHRQGEKEVGGELLRRLWPHPDPAGPAGPAGVRHHRRHDERHGAFSVPGRFPGALLRRGHRRGLRRLHGRREWPNRAAIPVFAVYSSFLQRAYDMLIHDVAIDKLHVVLGVDRAGLVGEDGRDPPRRVPTWPF